MTDEVAKEDINRVLTFSLSDSVIKKMNELDTEGNRSALIRGLIEQEHARKFSVAEKKKARD